MAIKTIDDVKFKRLRTFIRCDFNVPLDENGNITDDLRIVNSLPTIQKVITDGGKVILAAHLGRLEKGTATTLAPVAERLSILLDEFSEGFHDFHLSF